MSESFPHETPIPLGTLVTRLAAGQRESLEPLYRATVARAYAVAYRVLGEAALAEDAVAQTFIQVWEKPERYDSRLSSVPGWISMIARSRATDLLRRRRRHSALSLRSDGEVDSPDGAVTELAELATSMAAVLDSVNAIERRGLLDEALAQLPLDQRKALECAFFDGLSYAEVATRLGIPLGTIKTRIRSGLASLRSRLGPVGFDARLKPDPEVVE